MITTNNGDAGRAPTEYRRHITALEACARKLERGDLDPQEALDVYREAEEHYQAADAVLREVEHEFTRIQREREAEARGGNET